MKECDGFSRRCFAGSELSRGFECSVIRTAISFKKSPKNTVFSFNDKLYKQIDGCGMGNPLSPVLANIFMAKLEADVVRPFNPPFYDRYVDDCFSRTSPMLFSNA